LENAEWGGGRFGKLVVPMVLGGGTFRIERKITQRMKRLMKKTTQNILAAAERFS
jgi:hypothetical protein